MESIGGKKNSLCLVENKLCIIPNYFIYYEDNSTIYGRKEDTKYFCTDYTNEKLSLIKGEKVGIIKYLGKKVLIKKDNVIGFTNIKNIKHKHKIQETFLILQYITLKCAAVQYDSRHLLAVPATSLQPLRLLLDITGLKQNYCTAALYTGLHRKTHKGTVTCSGCTHRTMCARHIKWLTRPDA